MKVLYISEKVPYPTGGKESVRAYEHIKGLVEKGIHVECLFFHERFIYKFSSKDVIHSTFNTKEVKIYENKKRTLNRFLYFLKGHPFLLFNYINKEMTFIVEEVLENTTIDLIHVQSKIAINFFEMEFRNTDIVVDYGESDHAILLKEIEMTNQYSFKEWLLEEELRRLKNYEAMLQSVFTNGIIHSQEEKDSVIISESVGTIEVIPTTGIDIKNGINQLTSFYEKLIRNQHNKVVEDS
ncbi:hypothetical protein QA612_10260 [Evansella sp. AB-P1]|uniref:hypothetical protein n=1 Tax=Evansella sp. AB-P1 TaxID=3037653 RepID=UPI00241CC464|nr:hypothetical protein [Evansella sp. AB-P1]MDG5787882.1 hypothetical protein [Evansella sp. AB-P1]